MQISPHSVSSNDVSTLRTAVRKDGINQNKALAWLLEFVYGTGDNIGRETQIPNYSSWKDSWRA